MLKTARNIVSMIGILLAGISLLNKDFDFSPYIMVSLGILLMIIGAIELQKDKKGFWGNMCIIISLFAFYVSIQSFLIN